MFVFLSHFINVCWLQTGWLSAFIMQFVIKYIRTKNAAKPVWVFLHNRTECLKFELPEIEENFVFKYLSTLDISKATGLYGIGPRLLKPSSGIITKSITYIVNKCISNGIFPNLWKQAKVNPLFKGGDRDDVNNYRHISILPISSKLIEKFMQIHLMHYLNTFDVLHKFQSGFRSGHSTETALTLMTEGWLKAINDGNM